MLGNFFLSEGRPGNVIEVRVKGRRTINDIITLIQNCLYHYYYGVQIIGKKLSI